MRCSIAHQCTPLIRTLAPACATVVHSPAQQCIQLTWTYVTVYVTVHTNAQLEECLIPHHVNAYATQMVPVHLVRHSITLRANVDARRNSLAHQCIHLTWTFVNVCVTAHPPAQLEECLIPHHVNAYATQMVPVHLVRHSITLRANVDARRNSLAHQCIHLTWTFVNVCVTAHPPAQLEEYLIPHHVNAYATQMVPVHLVRGLITLRANVDARVNSLAHQCIHLTWTFVNVCVTAHPPAQLEEGLIPRHVNVYATQMVPVHLVRGLITLRANVNVRVNSVAHHCIHLTWTFVDVYATAHPPAQLDRALTPQYASAYVMQIPPARVARHSIKLHASVNAILSKNVVRAESLMRTRVAAFVRMCKNVQTVTFMIWSRVSVYAKEVYLRMSGMIDIANVTEITIRCLTSSHVAASVLNTRRETAMMEKSSTKILVSARGCAHMSTQDATDTTPLTTTPVGAGAAARVRTMRFLIQGTVCAKGRLPTHHQPGTPLHQRPDTPLLQRPGTPILQRPGTPILQRPGTPILQPPLSLHHPPSTPTHHPPVPPILQLPDTLLLRRGRVNHLAPMCARVCILPIHAIVLKNVIEYHAGKQTQHFYMNYYNI